MLTHNDMIKEKKEHLVRFRLTNQERKKIEKQANRCGMSLSEFCRNKILQTPDHFLSAEQAEKLYLELHEARVNFQRIKNYMGKDKEYFYELRNQAQDILNRFNQIIDRV